ncbi:MAG: ATP-binding protein [Vicinamibacterales bacterium]
MARRSAIDAAEVRRPLPDMTFTTKAFAAWVNRLAIALMLGGVGRVLLLNAPSLAEGVPLRLDEAVSLLSATALGPVWGAITSLTAVVGTSSAFSAVWPIEAFVVGVLVRRGWMPVLATTAFFALPGLVVFSTLVPLPALEFSLRLHWAKQVLNGVLSATIAQGLLALPGVRAMLTGEPDAHQASPLRSQIARAIVPLSALPLVALGFGLGRVYLSQLEVEGTRDLRAQAAMLGSRVEEFITTAEGEVGALAGDLSATSFDAASVRRALAAHHAGTPAFLTLLVTGPQGTVAAETRRVAGQAPLAEPAGRSVASEPYFREPARSGHTYRSQAIIDAAISPAPLVVVSAPYRTPEGAFAGVIAGLLDVQRIGSWVAETVHDPTTSVMVLDAEGRVLAATGPYAADGLASDRVAAWASATDRAPTGRLEELTSGRGRRTAVVARQDLATLGWQVHLRRPVRAMQSPLEAFYLLTALALIACLVIATPVASRVSRWITQPLEALAEAAESVDRQPRAPTPALPPSAPAEVRALQRTLEAMVARLDDSVALLDRKVRDRSAELAAATARSDTLFQAAGDGMVVLDPGDGILEANDAFCRLVGFDRDELLHHPLAELEQARVPDGPRDATGRTSRPARFETALRTRTGGFVPVEVVVTRLTGDGGRTIAAIRDISERRRAEAERVELEARLRQSQKMEAIGTLAGGIAHDFNNVLTLISGSTDLATAEVPEDHPVRPFLDQIARASGRAEALVRQILTFSRRRDEQREIVALAPIVQEAAGMLRSTLPAMIEIRAEIERDLPPVEADSVQIHQVLMNLAGNSAHAMRERGGTLSIVLRRHRTDAAGTSPQVELEVADTGTGMDRATLERAFDPFFTTKSAGEGTGLGLAVVHGIVTAHGGAVEVASEPGRGTTIRVILPAARPGSAPRPAEVRAAAPARAASVLVVDDEPELVGIVCKQLARLGYDAVGCGGPLEALAALANRRYDVVMSDLAMPKMSGIELAERIRRDHASVAIVLCSGRVTDEDRARAARAGVTEILSKPFARDDLAGAVARSLGPAAPSEAGRG